MLKAYPTQFCVNEILPPVILQASDAVIGSSFTLYDLPIGYTLSLDRIYRFNFNNLTYQKMILNDSSSIGYTITDDQLTITQALLTGDRLILLPTTRLDMLFSGESGDMVPVIKHIWLKRNAEFLYGSIIVTSVDISVNSVYQRYIDVTFSHGLSSTLDTMTVNEFVGCALLVNRQFVGVIDGNTTSQIQLVDTAYTQNDASIVEVINFGSMMFALIDSVTGLTVGNFVPVLNIADVSTDTPIEIAVKLIQVIPDAAVNLPNQIIRIRSTEFQE